jgi:hypothetical protein
MCGAHLERRRDHGAMAEMDAVEIAQCDHRAPGDLGGRGLIVDYGKSFSHFNMLKNCRPGCGAGRRIGGQATTSKLWAPTELWMFVPSI